MTDHPPTHTWTTPPRSRGERVYTETHAVSILRRADLPGFWVVSAGGGVLVVAANELKRIPIHANEPQT